MEDVRPDMCTGHNENEMGIREDCIIGTADTEVCASQSVSQGEDDLNE